MQREVDLLATLEKERQRSRDLQRSTAMSIAAAVERARALEVKLTMEIKRANAAQAELDDLRRILSTQEPTIQL